MSIDLLLIWSPGSGAWVGPGISIKDFAICVIFLLIVLMYLNAWSLVMQALRLNLFHCIDTTVDLKSRSKIEFLH